MKLATRSRLGHQGPYSGTATYGTSNIYANDTWQFSVMSYFAPEQLWRVVSLRYDAADGGHLCRPADVWNADHDPDWHLQVQRDGGFCLQLCQLFVGAALTIFDSSGNALDCSGYSFTRTIDLRPKLFFDRAH